MASGITNAPGILEDANFSLFDKMAQGLDREPAVPANVAGVIAMLASSDGAYITGTEGRRRRPSLSSPGTLSR